MLTTDGQGLPGPQVGPYIVKKECPAVSQGDVGWVDGGSG